MEEKKSIKISLSFILLVVAVMVIILLAFCLYFQRTSYNQQIATLENNIYEMTKNSGSMQNTIDELQGKLGTIANIINEGSENTAAPTENTVAKDNTVTNTTANTVAEESTTKAVYHKFTIQEIKSIDYEDNVLRAFFEEYSGKYVQITGYASDVGEDTISFDKPAYFVNLIEKDHPDRVYACAYTQDKEVYEQLKKLTRGQEVTVSGTVLKGTMPLTITDITINK